VPARPAGRRERLGEWTWYGVASGLGRHRLAGPLKGSTTCLSDAETTSSGMPLHKLRRMRRTRASGRFLITTRFDNRSVPNPYLLKSKVIHFIGHEKPQMMMDLIDKNINELEA
jgi:hypothetical protein